MEFDDEHHHRHRSEEEILMMNENTNSNNNADHSNNSSSLNRVKMVEALSQVQIQPTPAPAMTQSLKPRYRECMKNQAINVMGHAVDGCGEFLPAGPDGSLEALKCAACSCHRNFHRREEAGDTAAASFLYSHHHQPPSGPFGSHYRTTPSSGYLHLGPPPQPRPSTSGEDDDVLNPNGVAMGGTGNSNGKKRFRSKFTAEQKAKMLAMAERIEWRIQKCDDELLQQFFHETNVKRQVFKVWMHNNKHTLAKTNNNNHNSSSCNSSRQQLMN